MESNTAKDAVESSEEKDIKFPMLEFEKQIFIDMFEKDALLIMAKGLTYNTVLSNLLWVYKDPGNLVFVINSGDSEEKYFKNLFELNPLPALGPEREKAYLEGGVHFVSTRILVVDLLKNRIPIAHVTGIIVLRAHTVLESCQEAFALRLYRQGNKTGFIKGFSSSPISFTFGYHQVEKVMRALFVTELFLWPRFHGTVIKTLKRRQAEVEELHVPMTGNMTQIQTCLLDIMNYTVKQLKTTNRTLDLQEVTTENCITKKFHKILQSQLDCVWHQLGTRTKDYVQDLKALRGMIINLMYEDAVSFYALVGRYRSPEYARLNSGWILLDSAEQLFRLAKGRVFNQRNEFDPEPCPKWKVLSDLLLKDIPEDVRKKGLNKLSRTTILILCSDNKTCAQLNLYLTVGANRYLFFVAITRQVQVNSFSSNFKEYENQNTDIQDKDKEEYNIDEAEKNEYMLTLSQTDSNETQFEALSRLEDLDITQLETEKPIIHIRPFKQSGDNLALTRSLEGLRPDYVVLYQSDAAAVRQIELFEARKGPEEPRTKVYFIMHSKTVEEQAYLTALKREKHAFEMLIQTKSVMVVPTYQDGKTDEYFTMNLEEETDNADTRKAGGQVLQREAPLVVVDMREFRSELPALLHRRGLRIEPITISIGDYVLSPELCVERKSVSDLVGSLQSGRLFAQATQMCRHYARPILLIEFDQNRPFHLQGQLAAGEAGADVRQRLQLLTLHFPRLKLVWSPSPYATAELFAELKQGRPNPDVASLLAEQSAAIGEHMHEVFNVPIADFVRRLPGLGPRTAPRLMRAATNMKRLVTLTEEEIAEILDNKNDAKTLYTILHVNPSSISSTNKDEKQHYKGKFKGKFRGKNKK